MLFLLDSLSSSELQKQYFFIYYEKYKRKKKLSCNIILNCEMPPRKDKNTTGHAVSVYLNLKLRVRPVICGMYGVASLSVLYPLPPSISAILACKNSTSPSTVSSFSGILKEKEAKAILQLSEAVRTRPMMIIE